MESKILNINPYNDVELEHCFTHALMHIVSSYGKSITPYLLNTFVKYEIDNDGLLCAGKLLSREKRIDILSSQNIQEEGRVIEKTHIINEVERAIGLSHPVIAAVNCKYLTYRSEITSDEFHYITIYGFDKNENQLFIIDHSYGNRWLYDKHVTEYGEFLTAYESALEEMLDLNTRYSSFYEYKPADDQVHHTEANECGLKANLIFHCEQMIDNGLCFERHVKNIEELFKENYYSVIDKYAECCTSIISYKRREEFFLRSYVNVYPDILILLNENIRYLSILRGLLIKQKSKDMCSCKEMESLNDRFMSFGDKDRLFYAKLKQELSNV